MHLLPRLCRDALERALPELRRQFFTAPDPTGGNAGEISGGDRAQV
jgi:hypothetical protein